MKYLLIQGKHIEKGVEYKTGDVVESVEDLLRFKNKFRLLSQIKETLQETALKTSINKNITIGDINIPPSVKNENNVKRRRNK